MAEINLGRVKGEQGIQGIQGIPGVQGIPGPPGSDATVTIVDNLTTNDSTKVLSAKQGKILSDDLVAHKAEKATDTIRPHGLGKISSQDYEEGTWTPSITGSTVAGNHSYYSQIGRYVKVGKKVTVFFDAYINAFDANMSGDVKITGLPFPIKNNINFPIGSYRNIKFPANYYTLGGRMATASAIEIVENGIDVDQKIIASSDLRGASWLRGQFEYETN